MNRMFLTNYNTHTFVWGESFKYSIILNTKKIYKVGKLNKRLVF